MWNVDVAAAVSLLGSGVVDPTPLITARISLQDVEVMGFRRMLEDEEVLKILVAP